MYGSLGTALGNESNVTTSYNNLNITINGTAVSSTAMSGVVPIVIKNGTDNLLEFDYNFSIRSIDFSQITINDSSNSTLGSILISGINLSGMGVTKTVYMRRVDTSINSVCIKDAEITSILNVSSSCTGTSETKVECDGTTQGGYTCTYNSTSGFYKITGLNNSGIKQIDYTQPVTTTTTTTTSSSSGGGGGCYSKWDCATWSACNSQGEQTRVCTNSGTCSTKEKTETQPCIYAEIGTLVIQPIQPVQEEVLQQQEGTSNEPAQVVQPAQTPTGMAVKETKQIMPLGMSWLMLMIIVFSVIFVVWRSMKDNNKKG